MTSSQPTAVTMAQLNSQCMDPADISDFFDFNQLASPAVDAKARMSSQASALTSPTNTFQSLDVGDEPRLPMQPSHDYTRFKQQTGLPTQADHLRLLSSNPPEVFQNYNTGIYESQMWEGLDLQNGLDSNSDINFDTFLESFQNDDVIDPTAIQKQEEAQAQVRYYPGMHQQAALAKQMMLQKQKQREAEQQQQRVQAAKRSVSSQPRDQRTEETISRVMSEIRRSSSMAADSLSPTNGSVLPHILRPRKDEDDMDEDERLLNSEEGKKLSSKERRQLRNKVSARAFRSRRKEYIGQLEGEVAAKSNEAAELKRQNHALMEENARFRALAEKLLAHPAFHPFLDELSRDPALAESLSKVSASSVQPQANATHLPKDVDPYAASRQFIPQNNDSIVGMTMVPEVPVDLSSLNIGPNNSWSVPQGSQQMHSFQQPQVFAVTEVPQGPALPLDLSALSGKPSDAIFPHVDAEEKATVPELESPISKNETEIQELHVSEKEQPQQCAFDESDPSMCLFATSSTSSRTAEPKSEHETLFGDIAPEKISARFSLVVLSDEDNQNAMGRLERMFARLDASSRRLQVLTAGYWQSEE